MNPLVGTLENELREDHGIVCMNSGLNWMLEWTTVGITQPTFVIQYFSVISRSTLVASTITVVQFDLRAITDGVLIINSLVFGSQTAVVSISTALLP